MPEASRTYGPGLARVTVDAAVSQGEIWQLPTGQAAYKIGINSAASGDQVTWQTDGTVAVTKTVGVKILKGGRVYWDHSANSATYKPVNDRDFYIGFALNDAESADTAITVVLNGIRRPDIDLLNGPALSTLVGTAAAGGLSYPVPIGGSVVFEITATNEAQKVDLMSRDGFANGANAIIDYEFCVLSDGAGADVDVSIGVANGTHASDADAITESIFFHLNANDVNIYAESDDGTTEVNATDTTIDYTEGSAIAQRVYATIDMRNPADVQLYVNGALVLNASVFNVNVAAGPWFLLVHVEKTAVTDTYKLAIDRAEARFSQM